MSKEAILAKRKRYNIDTGKYGKFQDIQRTIQIVAFDGAFYRYILLNWDSFKTYKR